MAKRKKDEMRTVMRAEVKADCYSGPGCDQVRNQFEMYCDGDMDSDTGTTDIVIKCAELPPGAVVTIDYPVCPTCGIAREDKLDGQNKIVGHAPKCDCGFDWDKWVLDTYS